MSKLAFQKALKIGKADRYGIDVNSWLYGDALVSFDVVTPAGSGLVASGKVVAPIDGVNHLTCILSGAAAVGVYDIEFTYQTADRSDCQAVRLTVTDEC
jgi:hypothetical protein